MRQLLICAYVGVLLALPAIAGNDPMHGRPRYEKIGENEWIFYLTEHDTDWYLQPRVEVEGEIVKTLIRGVSPGVDNYGLLQINCKKKEYSAYYGDWTRIPTNSILANRMYKEFCNVKVTY